MLRVSFFILAALLVTALLPTRLVAPAQATNLNELIHEVCSTNPYQIDNSSCVGLLNTNYRQFSTESENGQWAMFCRLVDDLGLLESVYHFDSVVECHQAFREGTRGPGDNQD